MTRLGTVGMLAAILLAACGPAGAAKGGPDGGSAAVTEAQEAAQLAARFNDLTTPLTLTVGFDAPVTWDAKLWVEEASVIRPFPLSMSPGPFPQYAPGGFWLHYARIEPGLWQVTSVDATPTIVTDGTRNWSVTDGAISHENSATTFNMHGTVGNVDPPEDPQEFAATLTVGD